MTTKFLPTTLLLLEGERGECPHLFTIDDKESLRFLHHHVLIYSIPANSFPAFLPLSGMRHSAVGFNFLVTP